MRKILLAALSAIILFVGCQPQANTGEAKMNNEEMKNKKILVVYYTRTNNTEAVAKEIQKQTGADIFKIETLKPYPAEYTATTEQAKKEIAEGFKPEIKGSVANIKDYDIVFIGSPVWWGTIAPAVGTFISAYDLSGKTVVPFATHGGGGISRTFNDIKKLNTDSTFLEGFVTNGNNASSSEKAIEAWLKNIGLK